MSIEQWLKSGKYLPPILRDFHDQKDVFKAMHETIKPAADNDIMMQVNWINGQIYVIDIFLWFMARRGYTLQRSLTKLDFVSLDETVKQCNDRRSDAFAALLNQSTGAQSK